MFRSPVHTGDPVLDGERLEKAARGARGFVSPEGAFHPVGDHEDHHDWIQREVGDYGQALHNGWMSVGIGGEHNVYAMPEFIHNAEHPATKKVRELARGWGPTFELLVNSPAKHYDTLAFVHGHGLKEPNPHVLFKTEDEPKPAGEPSEAELDDKSIHFAIKNRIDAPFREDHDLYNKIKPEHLTAAIAGAGGGSAMMQAVLKHKNLTPEHIHQVLRLDASSLYSSTIDSTFNHPLFKPEHVDTALSSPNDYIRSIAVAHHSATPEHISRGLKDKHYQVRQLAIQNPNASADNIKEALLLKGEPIDAEDDTSDQPDFDTRLNAIKHPNVNSEHIEIAMTDPDRTIRQRAIRHPSATQDQLDRAAAMGDDLGMQEGVLQNPNAQPHHFDKILSGKGGKVPLYWMHVAHHPNISDSQADNMIALYSNPQVYPSVIEYLIKNPAVDPKHLTTIVRNEAIGVYGQFGIGIASNVAESPRVTPEALDVLLSHPNEGVQRAAVESKRILPGQLDKIAEREIAHPRLSIDIVGSLLRNQKLSSESIGKLMDRLPLRRLPNGEVADTSSQTWHRALEHDNATPEILQRGIDSDVGGLVRKAATHDKVTPEQLYQILQKVKTHPAWTNYEKIPVMNGVLESPRLPLATLHGMAVDPAFSGYLGTIKQKIQEHDPDSSFNESVAVAPGLAKLRQVRDLIQKTGKDSISPKELPKGDWAAARLPNGEISAAKIQQLIDAAPRQKWNVSHTTWDGGQQHSKEDSNVFQMNLTTDLVNQLKADGTWPTFKRMTNASFSSGHPVNKHTIGWVRYTTGQDGNHHIDEVQSDFGQSFVKQAAGQAREQAAQDAESQGLTGKEAKDYVDNYVKEATERAKTEYPDSDYEKIFKTLFQGRKPNEIIAESFLQHLRDKGHVGKKLAMPDASLKGPISGMDMTKPLPGHFQHTYIQMPQRLGLSPSVYGDIETQNNPAHKGKLTWADTLRKRLAKMAIPDLKPGKLSNTKPSAPEFKRYDYSHLLTPEHRQAGYKLFVEDAASKLTGKIDVGRIRSILEHPSATGERQSIGWTPSSVGQISGLIQHGESSSSGKRLRIGVSEIHNTSHRGKGLAIPMYEALYAHAYHKRGADRVYGEEHSTAAHGVHMKLATKHQLRYRAQLDPDMARLKPEDFDGRFGEYGYSFTPDESMPKLNKMAIADIKPGNPIGQHVDKDPNYSGNLYDYSHVLTPEHRKAGYSIQMLHRPQAGTHLPAFSASLSYKGKPISRLTGYKRLDGALEPHVFQDLDEGHRGKGLGVAMYESLYGHAMQNGIRRVAGGEHSNAAARVHESLSRKHGMDYQRKPLDFENYQDEGDADRYPNAPYDYVLKSEGSLAKHDTPEFQGWFQGSHVATPEGKPLRVYHGTSKDVDFNTFKVGRRGAWFTSDPAEASQYAKDNDSQGLKYNLDTRSYDRVNQAPRVIPAHLSLKNPYTVTDEDRQALNSKSNYQAEQGRFFDQLKLKGHDGVVWGHGIYVAFHPHQIKGAFNTKPTQHKAFNKGEHKDRIPGGLSDNKSPRDFDDKKLKQGVGVELEHTSDKGIAQEIAMDHLTEDSEYYQKLKTIEKDEPSDDREIDRIALVCVFNAAGKLLIGTRNDNGRYTLPGGHLDEGEEPEAGALRELKEETGLTPDSIEKMESRDIPGLRIHVFKATVSDDAQPHGADDPDEECEEWQWVDISEGIPKDIAEELHGPVDPGYNVLLDTFGFKKSEKETPLLSKASPPPKFTKLGIEDRRETPLETNPKKFDVSMNPDDHGAKTKQLAMATRSMGPEFSKKPPLVGFNTPTGTRFEPNLFGLDHAQLDSIGFSQRANGGVHNTKVANVSFSKDDPLRHDYGEPMGISHGYAGLATQHHENWHQLMRRVEHKHGKDARSLLVDNLHRSVHPVVMRGVSFYTDWKNRGTEPGSPYRKEEDIAALHNYLNNPHERRLFFRANHITGTARHKIDRAIKIAYKTIRRSAHVADERWMTHSIPFPHRLTDAPKFDFEGSSFDPVYPNSIVIRKPKRMRQPLAKSECSFTAELHKAEADEIDRLLMHPDPIEKQLALKLGGVREKHLVRALEFPETRQLALANPALGPNGIASYFRHPRQAEGQLECLSDDRIQSWHLQQLFETHRGNGSEAAVVQAILAHPLTDSKIIDSLYASGHREASVAHHAASPELLKQILLQYMILPTDPKARELAAIAVQHPNVPYDLLDKVWEDSDREMRCRIAGGPKLPEVQAFDVMVLGHLPIYAADAHLRWLIVTHKQASDRILKTGSQDPVPEVKQAALEKLLPHMVQPFAKSAREWLAKMAMAPGDLSTIHHDYPSKSESDHKPDLAPLSPGHESGMKAFKEAILDNPQAIKRQPIGDDTEGVSPKVVYKIPGDHPTHAGARFMVKPYYEDFKDGNAGAALTGWAEMSNQALYHAGGIGHIHQKVHVVMAGKRPKPMLAIEMSKHHEPLSSVSADGNSQAKKIAFMDWIINNKDRHERNLLSNQDGHVLAIDHSYSFNYPERPDSSPFTNTFHGFMGYNPELAAAAGYRNENYGEDWSKALDWWGSVSGRIKETMNKRLELVKDPVRRSALRTGFLKRANYLDELANHPDKADWPGWSGKKIG